MNIEEALEIIEKEDANPSWHGIRIAEYRYARYFLEGYKSGLREALESEAVKGLVKALEYIQTNTREIETEVRCECALSRFNQFKQEVKCK